jgi:AcrR family transcriptional regulator
VTTRGRPRIVSPAMLAEAACELFLEQGYQQTSADDIANRAGVSRATFFNYFPAKADVLFWDVDEALEAVETLVGGGLDALAAIITHAHTINHTDRPLIASQAETMSVMEDVWRVGPARVERLRKIIASQFPESFAHWQITAAIVSAALSWATETEGGTTLSDFISASLERVGNAVKDSV